MDSTKVLMDAGIMRDADLVLEVKGVEALFSGSPVTLKVRVEDAKTFTVKATMVRRPRRLASASARAAARLFGRKRAVLLRCNVRGL